MTFDLESSHLLSNLDVDELPRYNHKAPDFVTLSSPRKPTMADLYTTVSDYTQLVLLLSCLLGAFVSMPFINLCSGGGSIAGTIALAAGMSILLYNYFKRGFLCQGEDPLVPHDWYEGLYYFLTIVLPFIFATLFGLVLQVSITHCCNTIPDGHKCASTPSTPSPTPSPTPLLYHQG